MSKKIAALALAVALCLGILPTQIFAKVGKLIPVNFSSGMAEFTISQFGSTFSTSPYEGYPEGTYYILYNDYITFVLWPDGSSTTAATQRLKELILAAKTGPIKSTDEAKRLGLTRTERIDFAWCFEDWALMNDVLTTPKQLNMNKDRFLPVGKHQNVTAVKADGFSSRYHDREWERVLTATYTTSQWNGKVTYSLVQLGENSRSWGVRVDADMTETYDDWETLKPPHKQNQDRLFQQIEMHPNGYPFVMITEHYDFTMKANGTSTWPVYSTFYVDFSESVIHPTTNTSNVRRKYHFQPTSVLESGQMNEVYTYSGSPRVAEPFVATGNYFFGGNLSGAVDGHYYSGGGWSYGDYYAYVKQSFVNARKSGSDTLITYNFSGFTAPFAANDRSHSVTSALWGLHHLYAAGMDMGTDVEYTPPEPNYDFSQVNSGAVLGIVKDSNGLVAVASRSQSELESKHGKNLVAVLRGDFAMNADTNKFEFFNGKMGLSSNITASWGDDGYFRVTPNGQIETKGVTLACPAFDFFVPRKGGSTEDLTFYATRVDGDGKTIPGYDSKEFYIGFKPKANAAHLAIDIPGFTSEFNGVTVGLNGDVAFDGSLDISLPLMKEVADIRLDRLSLGNKANPVARTVRYGVTVLEGGGHVGFPEFFSLEVPEASADADINYEFRNPRKSKFNFSLSLSVPELFAIETELQLKGLYNGWIFPNKVWVAGETAQGLDIVPTAPVASITGLGGGIDGLADSVNVMADTINGNFMALPPFRLMLQGKAELVKIFSGKANVTLGLGYLGTEMSDPEIFGVKMGSAKAGQELFITAEGRWYEGKKYIGVAFGGGNYFDFKFPSAKTDILVIDAGVKAKAFGGVTSGGEDIYLAFDGSGWVEGKIQIPNGTVAGVDIPQQIRGQKIASRSLKATISGSGQAALRGRSVSTVAKDLMANSTVDAIISYDGEILSRPYWIKAIFKDKVIDMGYDGWFIDKQWRIPFGHVESNATRDGVYTTVIYQPDVVLLASTSDLTARSGANSTVDQELPAGAVSIRTIEDHKHIITIDGSKIGAENLHFQLSPKTPVDEADVLDLFTITDQSGNVLDLVEEEYPRDSAGNITDLTAANPDEANAFIFQQTEGVSEGLNENYKEGYYGVTVMVPSAGEWVFETAGTAFDIDVLGFALPARIDSADLDGNLSYDRLAEEKTYVLNLSYVDEEGQYHTIRETEFDGDAPVTRLIPGSDPLNVPSGDYDVVYTLSEKVVYGAAEEEYYVFFLDEHLAGSTAYINPEDVPAPTDVVLEPIGSEVMRASWTAPSGFDADGYAVTVYQKRGGEWTSTGAVYEVKADENGVVPTSVDMALTFHGINGTVDEKTGAIIPDPAQADLLAAEQTYRVGVRTLQDLKVEYSADPDDYDIYSKKSEEALSAEKELPKANYPKLSYSPAPMEMEGEIKTAYVAPGRSELKIQADQPVCYQVTVMDTAEEIYATASGAEYESAAITVPQFAGSMILQITAVNEQGDMVTDVLQLRYDETAPVIVLDNDFFQAESDGTFRITGVTESSARIAIAGGENYDPALESEYNRQTGLYEPKVTVEQKEDGSFTLTGKINEEYQGLDVSVLVTATDEAGNSEGAMAMVQPVSELTGLSVTTPPDKTVYDAGESFDPTGMAVTAAYSDGSTAEVTGYAEIIDQGRALTAADTEMVIRYTEGGTTVTATQAITVHPVATTLESIAVTTQPAKTHYTEGESFDPTGMVVTAAYSDGSTAEVTGYTCTPDGALTLADTTVTVSYQEGGITKTATLAITVEPAAAGTYLITFDPNGGSVSPRSVSTDAQGKLSSLPTADPRANYTFDGWYTAPSGGEKVDEDTVFTADTTVYARWTYTGGSGGGYGLPTTYPITVAASENGTVSVSPTGASGGSKVTVTATPHSGFEPDVIQVIGPDGKEIPVTKNEDGTYCFTMPRGKVTVTATFKEIAHDCPSRSFADVNPEAWYHEAVDFVTVKGLMQGTAADRFAPELATSRAMIVTILYRLEGAPAVTDENPFKDVKPGQWYTDAVLWAAAGGIVEGYDDENGDRVFDGDRDITREQLAAILYRYAKHKGFDVSAGEDADILSYDDAFHISAWALEPMRWAVGVGLINGRTESTLAPQGDATRGEAAAILMRFIENVK